MNLFRRLFGQPVPTLPREPASAAASAPEPSIPSIIQKDVTLLEPLDRATEIAVPNANTNTNANSKPTTAPLSPEARFKLSEGVTRPLPQEPLAPSTGGEHLIFGQMTDVGVVRSNNQDAALSFFTTARSSEERPDFGMFVVADGMGGHHDGEKASALCTRTLVREITNTIYLPMVTNSSEMNSIPISEVLVNAVQKANADVLSHVPDGGTTLTAVTIIGDLAYVAHVGDSRVYLINGETVEQITRDHSLVQRLIELDQLTPEEAAEHPQKNVLYRALGQNDNLEVDTLTRRLPPKSRLLLCSDGLWNQVPERVIRDIVMKHSNPQNACEELVARANAHGGLDNVTAIVLYIPG